MLLTFVTYNVHASRDSDVQPRPLAVAVLSTVYRHACAWILFP